MLTKKQILQIFHLSGGLLEGHFKLRSGLHSSKFLQSAAVLQYPKHATALCRALAEKIQTCLPEHRQARPIDAVIGPAIGGVILAYEVAKALGARALFGEKCEGDQPAPQSRQAGMILRPGFEIKPDEHVVIVDDVLTTGGSVSQLIDIVNANQASVVATGFLIDRSDGVDFGIPKIALVTIDIPTYTPEKCPLCQMGESLMET